MYSLNEYAAHLTLTVAEYRVHRPVAFVSLVYHHLLVGSDEP